MKRACAVADLDAPFRGPEAGRAGVHVAADVDQPTLRAAQRLLEIELLQDAVADLQRRLAGGGGGDLGRRAAMRAQRQLERAAGGEIVQAELGRERAEVGVLQRAA